MPTAEARAQRKRALILATLALVVSLAANAFVSVLLLYTRAQAADYSECAADWQQQFSVAYKARADANAQVQEALSKVMLSLPATTDTQFDRDKFQESLREYATLYRAQVKEREEHPLPPLPETLCGKIGGDG